MTIVTLQGEAHLTITINITQGEEYFLRRLIQAFEMERIRTAIEWAPYLKIESV